MSKIIITKHFKKEFNKLKNYFLIKQYVSTKMD